MLWLAADENFNGRILRGLQRRMPDLNILRIQDTEIYGSHDPAVLEWAAAQNRVLLTHDLATLVGYAYDRLATGESLPGVIAVNTRAGIGPTLEDLEILLRASRPEELAERVIFIPL